MTYFETVVTMFSDLDPDELSLWIEERWVQPERVEGRWVFHDIDIARVRLIYDLRRDFDASAAAVPLLLSLIDQLYEQRRNMSALRRALARQSAEVQAAVSRALEEAQGPDSQEPP